jgi:transcriptional regulator with XRE-family HTH domain
MRTMSTPLPSGDDLARAIRRLRADRGFSIDDLAARSGIHPTYLSRIERNISNPTWSKLSALADTLGIRPSELALAAEDESRRRDEARSS